MKSHNDITADFSTDEVRQILQRQDGSIRKALIELGWTPPPAMKALDIPRGPEQYLRRQLADLHREYQERCRPIVEALASYEALRPKPPMVVDLESIDPEMLALLARKWGEP